MLADPSRKFRSRTCYGEAYRRRTNTNAGWFKKGQDSLNRGHTPECWLGKERASEIKPRMSLNSKGAESLRRLGRNPSVRKKRADSRHVHEEIVRSLVMALRAKGQRCYILSEHVKEERTSGAIPFDGKELVAIEVVREKQYKASHEAIPERLETLNGKSGYFDRTQVVFAPPKAEVKRSAGRSAGSPLSKH